VAHVVVESRGGSDKWDRRTRERLRRSHQITSAVRVDHARKRADGRLWLADFVAGAAYFGALVHGDTEPWTIVEAARMIEVVTIPV
jgi:hypothetical protein